MKDFLQTLKQAPQNNAFETSMAIIDQHYTFTPCEFNNGRLINEANQNNGSCKIFAFAQLHNLSEQQTLHCFGDYYRIDVLQNPGAEDHQNIRYFIKHGWDGISFSLLPLSKI
ncbi:Type III effector HopPmaJ [hydrothermal vent metagenome]|uniref:Type III effector HopPmaJ n=1 Tax=hydrothermal vent metagenome TaxID=652676 RepID=A0A3B0X0G2_9ZZZZ